VIPKSVILFRTLEAVNLAAVPIGRFLVGVVQIHIGLLYECFIVNLSQIRSTIHQVDHPIHKDHRMDALLEFENLGPPVFFIVKINVRLSSVYEFSEQRLYQCLTLESLEHH
jgi:hypothetical protein